MAPGAPGTPPGLLGPAAASAAWTNDAPATGGPYLICQGTSSSGATITVPVATPTNPGDLIVVASMSGVSTTAATAPSDTEGNNYVSVVNDQGASHTGIAISQNPVPLTSSDSISYTYNSSSTKLLVATAVPASAFPGNSPGAFLTYDTATGLASAYSTSGQTVLSKAVNQPSLLIAAFMNNYSVTGPPSIGQDWTPFATLVDHAGTYSTLLAWKYVPAKQSSQAIAWSLQGASGAQIWLMALYPETRFAPVGPVPQPPGRLSPGAWSYQPGLNSPRTRAEQDSVISCTGSMHLAPKVMSASGSPDAVICETSGYTDIYGDIYTADGFALAPPAIQATGSMTLNSSGSMALAPLAVKAPQQPAGLELGPMAMSVSGYVQNPFPIAPLNMLIELQVNGTWTDITGFVYQRDNLVVTRGQPDETQSITSSSLTMTLNNRDGRFSPKDPRGAYYGFIGRNTQIRISAPMTAANVDLVYRFWGEVSAWPPVTDQTGNDMTVQITASGIWRRLGQNATIGSPLTRYYQALTGSAVPAGYWPCEDPSSASRFASGLPDGTPMSWSGTPSLSSDSSFGGSDPIPQVSGSTWSGNPGSYLTPGEDLFSVPGTYTYTAPGGTASIKAECWGGGGGGGAGDNGSGSPLPGGGGGGGEYAAEATLAVTPGTDYTVVVGQGGAGGTSPGAGAVGQVSTVKGDSVTVTAHPGNPGTNGGHGTGGSGSSNSTHHNGGAGSNPGSGGGYPGDQVFTSSGSWTAPDGVDEVEAYCYGGGGSGGGSEHFYYGEGAGGGGGGGGSGSGTVAVTGGSDYAVTVGQGGAAVSGTASGNDGAASTFQGDSDTVSGPGGQRGFSSSASNAGEGGAGGSGGGAAGADAGVYDGGGGGDGAGGGSGGSRGLTTGAGGPGSAYGGGGGGAGTPKASGAASSGAGAKGYVEIQWTTAITEGPGGGGGGSGGTSAAGNNGGIPTGATAVASGGPGGAGGSGAPGTSPLVGPGGGGGGGDAAGSYGGGNGYPGQVKITAGSSSAPNANVLRFLMHLDAGGSPDGAVIAELDTAGTVAKLQLVYHTGGDLELIGYNSSDTVVFDSGSKAVTADGTLFMISVAMVDDGTGTIQWQLQAIEPGLTNGVLTFGYYGTFSGSLGSVEQVLVNPGGLLASSSIGQISVQYVLTALDLLNNVIAGYAGELARDRFARLCGGFNIPVTVYSPTCFDFSDGTTDNWTGENGSVSNSTAWFWSDSLGTGSYSLLLTSAGGSGQWAATSGPVLAVFPGDLVSAYSDVYTPDSLGAVGVNIDWFNAAQAYLSTTGGTTAAVDVTVAFPQNLLAVAPPNAAFAAVTVVDNETVSAGKLLYMSNIRFDRNPMGPQTDAQLTDLLQEVATMDGGFIFEPRDSFGLAYNTLAQVQNPTATVIADYSLAQVAMPFSPTEDDQNTRNYITVTRGTASGVSPGSSYITSLTSGAMSVQDPPNGVGQYSYSATANCYADSQLAQIAAQILTVGTVDEMRYPVINFDLTRTESVPIFTNLVDVDSADMIEIDNAAPQMGYGPIRQLALGFAETLNNFVWTMAFNCVPESPYETGS